jgi:hypothetical protein
MDRHFFATNVAMCDKQSATQRRLYLIVSSALSTFTLLACIIVLPLTYTHVQRVCIEANDRAYECRVGHVTNCALRLYF